MTRDYWMTGPTYRAREQDKDKRKVLVVLDPALFVKRDSKGGIDLNTVEFSSKMLSQATEKYRRVLIFPIMSASLSDTLSEFLKAEGRETVEVLKPHETEFTSALELLKRRILELGGKVRRVKNPREISLLNLHQFVDSDKFLFAKADDWQEVGLELDKPKSFDDLSKERQNKSFW